MRIEAYRGAGDRPGDDVEASLLSGEAALIERAWAELNDRAHQREALTLTGVAKVGMLPGRLIVNEPVGRSPWVGRVVSVTFAADGVRSTATLGVERPKL
jgi:hypothetical protein